MSAGLLWVFSLCSCHEQNEILRVLGTSIHQVFFPSKDVELSAIQRAAGPDFLQLLGDGEEAQGLAAAALAASPPPRGAPGATALSATDAAFWGTLGHLYAAARTELVRLVRQTPSTHPPSLPQRRESHL